MLSDCVSLDAWYIGRVMWQVLRLHHNSLSLRIWILYMYIITSCTPDVALHRVLFSANVLWNTGVSRIYCISYVIWHFYSYQWQWINCRASFVLKFPKSAHSTIKGLVQQGDDSNLNSLRIRWQNISASSLFFGNRVGNFSFLCVQWGEHKRHRSTDFWLKINYYTYRMIHNESKICRQFYENP